MSGKSCWFSVKLNSVVGRYGMRYIEIWPQNWPQCIAFTIVAKRWPFLATRQCCVESFQFTLSKSVFKDFIACLLPKHISIDLYLVWNQFDKENWLSVRKMLDVQPNHKPICKSFTLRNEPDLSFKYTYWICAIRLNRSLFWLRLESSYEVRISWLIFNDKLFYEIISPNRPETHFNMW